MWFSRNRHKIVAIILTFAVTTAASMPLLAQPAKPTATDTTSPKNPPRGNEPEHGQPKVESNKTGLDAATDVKIQHHFNELRRELLNYRSNMLELGLALVIIFLTIISVIAVLFGYISFKRFEKIEADAQRYVEEIKTKRDEADSLVKGLNAEVVRNDPKKASETAERVQADPESSPIDQAIAAAILLQREGKIEEAIEKWRSIANVVEETNTKLGSQAWFSAGYLYGELDDFEAKRNAYTQAIRLNPDYAEAYNNRGNAKNSLGQSEAAIADYDEAIRIDKKFADAYNNRGNAKNNLGQSEAALADYNMAIQLNPNDAETYYNRGVTNKRLGRVNEARQDFDTAINLFRNAGNSNLATAAEQQLRDLDNP